MSVPPLRPMMERARLDQKGPGPVDGCRQNPQKQCFSEMGEGGGLITSTFQSLASLVRIAVWGDGIMLLHLAAKVID